MFFELYESKQNKMKTIPKKRVEISTTLKINYIEKQRKILEP